MKPLATIAAAAAVAGVGLVATPTVAHAAPTGPTITAPVKQVAKFTSGHAKGSIEFDRIADSMYQAKISGTTSTSSNVTLPVSHTSGLSVPTGTFPMASGAGTMTLTNNQVTFSFNKAFLNTHIAPFTFSGTYGMFLTTNTTSAQSDTIAGNRYTITVKAPGQNVGANGGGRIRTVTETVEVDRAVLKNLTVLNIYNHADDNGGLGATELSKLYRNRAYAPYFSEQHVFVTITVPINATPAQRLAAVNAKTPARIGDLRTTQRAGVATKFRRPVTEVTAWRLDTAHGARPVDGGPAFGPHHNLQEFYVGRG